MEEKKKENIIHPGDANQITRAYMDSILVEQRLIGSEIASLECKILGSTFQTPIMLPAFSHLNHWMKEQDNAMVAYTKAAMKVGALNWVGMCENEEFADYADVYKKTVRIVKPYADRGKVIDQLQFAESCGAFAVGMDIDHCFGNDGGYDIVFGEAMTSQSLADLKEYVNAVKIPFVVKGILSVSDALKCAEAGAGGILISHHHGRMPFAVPPLMVLPKIRQALKEYPNISIMADCGINSGIDAFKALALGADAVAVGRALIPELAKKGMEGVASYIEKMNQELRMMMNYTGCRNTENIDASVLWIDQEPVPASFALKEEGVIP